MRVNLLFAAFAIILLTSGCINGGNYVCIRERCFSVEFAVTPDERAKGLMERDNLESGSGMLFVFEEEGRYSFWMKNTRIPLDMIWISGEMEISYISRNAQPCEEAKPCPSIDPPADAKYVLEVNAGESQGFEIGDSVRINAEI